MTKKSPYKGPDRFTTEAKKQGYPARSVFKLEEIDRRLKLLKGGMRVLDLGAAPGSWSLYVANKIGPSGKLFAVDLTPLRTGLPSWATFLQGDAFAIEDGVVGTYAPYDLVLSDMAPNTTGNRFADQARSFDLFMRALEVAERTAAPGGAFVGKIFMGEDFKKAEAAVKNLFREVRTLRPEGTRSVSYEVFLAGQGRKDKEARA